MIQRNRNRNWDLNKLSQLGELGGWEILGPHTDLKLMEGLPWVWAQALPLVQGLQPVLQDQEPPTKGPASESPVSSFPRGADQGQPG